MFVQLVNRSSIQVWAPQFSFSQMRHTPTPHCPKGPHPPPALSLQRPTLGLGIPLNIQDTQTPPPTFSDPLPPFPSTPPRTHTHLIVIDSVFVPLCVAVASDEDTYTELRRCAHCTPHRNYRSATSCIGRLMTRSRAVGLGECNQPGHGRDRQGGMGQGVCRQDKPWL